MDSRLIRLSSNLAYWVESRFQFCFVVHELVQRQGQKRFDACANNAVSLLKGSLDFLFGSDHMARVLDTPMSAYDWPEVGWAGLPGGATADSDDDVRRYRKTIP